MIEQHLLFASPIEQTREKRGIGKRAASVYGYHSLRATFVVIAGMSEDERKELARKPLGL